MVRANILPPQGSVHWRREIHTQRQAECNLRTTHTAIRRGPARELREHSRAQNQNQPGSSRGPGDDRAPVFLAHSHKPGDAHRRQPRLQPSQHTHTHIRTSARALLATAAGTAREGGYAKGTNPEEADQLLLQTPTRTHMHKNGYHAFGKRCDRHTRYRCKDDRLTTFSILACDTFLGSPRHAAAPDHIARPSLCPPSHRAGRCTAAGKSKPCLVPRGQTHTHSHAHKNPAPAVRPRVHRPARGCEPAKHTAAGAGVSFLCLGRNFI